MLDEDRANAIAGDIFDVPVVEKRFEDTHIDFVPYEEILDGLVFLLGDNDLSIRSGGNFRKTRFFKIFFFRKIGVQEGDDPVL